MRRNLPRRRIGLVFVFGLIVMAVGVAVWIRAGLQKSGPSNLFDRENATASQLGDRRSSTSNHSAVSRIAGPVTFNKDVAPIVFAHCASCHRPGESAPFSLLTYQDVRKRAKQIAEVTQSRYMPPWLPEPGYGAFVGERLLTTQEIALITQWLTEGTVEGAPSDLPPLPKWSDGWQLGKPDLVVTLPQPYALPAEGKDVYRNFVIPIPTSSGKYVRALEFQPGNRKIVHHAFMLIDRTRQSRKLDEQDPEPGFPGLHTPPGAQAPEGHFLSWQPGKVPSQVRAGLAWPLEKESDLILQTHLQPSGKPEVFQPSIGFFFTDQAPTNTPFKIGLRSFDIDISPGVKDHVLQNQYVLPVDAHVLSVLPHAHYLGKQLQAWAMLPGGTKQSLFLIKQWDFNWQGDYRYVQPLFLPKGTVISMHYTYDNSSDNVRNPNQPPQRVRYGLQSTDEMGELWLQLLPRNSNDLAILAKDYQPRVLREVIQYNEYLLRVKPDDARAHRELGKGLLFQGRQEEALQRLKTAAQLEAGDDETHYYLGLLFRMRKQMAESRTEFETALRLNPDHGKAHGNLGFVCLEQGELTQAERHFKEALRVNPDDSVAREGLELVSKERALPPKH